MGTSRWCDLCGAATGCVVLVLPGEPVSKERPRLGNRGSHTYTPSKTQTAEKALAALWPARQEPFTSPVRVDLFFVLETRRRKDIDNLVKTVLDAGLGTHGAKFYADDSLIHHVTARLVRGAGKGNAYTVAHFAPLLPEDLFWSRMAQRGRRPVLQLVA